MSTASSIRTSACPRQVAQSIAERVGEEPRQISVKMVARKDVRRFLYDIHSAQTRSREKAMAVD